MISSRFSVKKFLSRGSRRETGASAEHHHQHHSASDRTNRARTSTRTSPRTGPRTSPRTWMTAGIAAMAALAAMATITATADSAQAQTVTLTRIGGDGAFGDIATTPVGGDGGGYQVEMIDMIDDLGDWDKGSHRDNSMAVRINLGGARGSSTTLSAQFGGNVGGAGVVKSDLVAPPSPASPEITIVHDLVKGEGGYLGSGYIDGGNRDDIVFVFTPAAFSDDNGGSLTFQFFIRADPSVFDENVTKGVAAWFVTDQPLLLNPLRPVPIGIYNSQDIENVIRVAGGRAVREGSTAIELQGIGDRPDIISLAGDFRQYQFTAPVPTGPRYTISGPEGGADLTAGNPTGSSFTMDISDYVHTGGTRLVTPVDIKEFDAGGREVDSSNSGIVINEGAAINNRTTKTLNVGNFTLTMVNVDNNTFFLTRGKDSGDFAVAWGGITTTDGNETARINIVANSGATTDVESRFIPLAAARYNSISTGGSPSGKAPNAIRAGGLFGDARFTPIAPVPRVRITQAAGAVLSSNGRDSSDFVVSVENYQFPLKPGTDGNPPTRGLNAETGRWLAITIDTNEPSAPIIANPSAGSTCVTAPPAAANDFSGCMKSVRSQDFTINLPLSSDAFFVGGATGTTSEFRLMVPRGVDRADDPNNRRLNASYTLTVTAGSLGAAVDPGRRDTPRIFALESATPFRRLNSGEPDLARIDGAVASLIGTASFTAGAELAGPTATLTVTEATARESGTLLGEFQIDLSNLPNNNDVVIPYGFGGTAGFGASGDYTVSLLDGATFTTNGSAMESGDSITVPGGTNMVRVVITAVDDTEREAGIRETVTLTLATAGATPSDLGFGPNGGTGSLTIADGDATDTTPNHDFTDVCDRTPAVRELIGTAVPKDCADITASDLEALAGVFQLTDEVNGDLKLGDLDDLRRTTEMNLADNEMTTLPDNIFRDLERVTNLRMHGSNNIDSVNAATFTGLDAVVRIIFSDRIGTTGNQNLIVADGAFDQVLDTLDRIYIRNGLKRYANFAGSSVSVAQARSDDETLTIRLDTTVGGGTLGLLPAAVFVPVTVSGDDKVKVAGSVMVDGNLVTTDGGVIIPAGMNTVPVTITADSDAGITGGGTPARTLTIGAPRLGVINSSGVFTANTIDLEASSSLAAAGTGAPTAPQVSVTEGAIGVCDRTTEVEDKIRSALVGEGLGTIPCEDVTLEHLGMITRTLNANAGVFDLSNTVSTSLKTGDFVGLSMITTVDVFGGVLGGVDSSNRVSDPVPASTFDGLNNSAGVRINLRSQEQLTSIHEDAFKQGTGTGSNVSVLTITRNPNLTDLPEGLLRNSPELTHINASDSGINALHAGLFALNTKLTEINLTGNPIPALPVGFLDGPLSATPDSLTSVQIPNNRKRQVALTTPDGDTRNNILPGGTLTLTMQVQDTTGASGSAIFFPADLTATLEVVGPTSGTVTAAGTITVEAGTPSKSIDIALDGTGIPGEAFTVQLKDLMVVHTTDSSLTNDRIVGTSEDDAVDFTAAAKSTRTIAVGTGTPTNDASLNDLTVEPTGGSPVAFTSVYDQASTSNAYTVNLDFGTRNVTVFADPNTGDAVVKSITGNAAGTGAILGGGVGPAAAGANHSADLTGLRTGENTIRVVVTPGDASADRTYVITADVADPRTEATLTALSLTPSTTLTRTNTGGACDGGVGFLSTCRTYTAVRTALTPTVTVTATSADDGSTFAIAGTTGTDNTPSAPIILAGGENIITVDITAENLVAVLPYVITLTVPFPDTGAPAFTTDDPLILASVNSGTDTDDVIPLGRGIPVTAPLSAAGLAATGDGALVYSVSGQPAGLSLDSTSNPTELTGTLLADTPLGAVEVTVTVNDTDLDTTDGGNTASKTFFILVEGFAGPSVTLATSDSDSIPDVVGSEKEFSLTLSDLPNAVVTRSGSTNTLVDVERVRVTLELTGTANNGTPLNMRIRNNLLPSSGVCLGDTSIPGHAREGQCGWRTDKYNLGHLINVTPIATAPYAAFSGDGTAIFEVPKPSGGFTDDGPQVNFTFAIKDDTTNQGPGNSATTGYAAGDQYSFRIVSAVYTTATPGTPSASRVLVSELTDPTVPQVQGVGVGGSALRFTVEGGIPPGGLTSVIMDGVPATDLTTTGAVGSGTGSGRIELDPGARTAATLNVNLNNTADTIHMVSGMNTGNTEALDGTGVSPTPDFGIVKTVAGNSSFTNVGTLQDGDNTLTILTRIGSGDVSQQRRYTITVHVPTSAGLCDRTDELETVLLALITATNDCNLVTTAHLNAITGRLDLRTSGITSLKDGDFDDLIGITRLTLTNIPLAGGLGVGVLDGLSGLLELELANTGLTNSNLAATAFDGIAASLTELSIGGNSGLTSLGTISSNTNNATTAIKKLTRLESLDMFQGGLRTIGANAFSTLTRLTSLRMHDNTSLDTLDVDAFNGLANLTTLDLDDNIVTTVTSGTFDGLGALTTLDLGRGTTLTNSPDRTSLDLTDTTGNKGVLADVVDTLTSLTLNAGEISTYTPTSVVDVKVPTSGTRERDVMVTIDPAPPTDMKIFVTGGDTNITADADFTIAAGADRGTFNVSVASGATAGSDSAVFTLSTDIGTSGGILGDGTIIADPRASGRLNPDLLIDATGANTVTVMAAQNVPSSMVLTTPATSVTEGTTISFVINISDAEDVTGDIDIPYVINPGATDPAHADPADYAGILLSSEISGETNVGSFTTATINSVPDTPVIRIPNSAFTADGIAQATWRFSTLANDGIDEALNETITIVLTKPDNIATFATPVNNVLTIVDEDDIDVRFGAIPTLNETDANVEVDIPIIFAVPDDSGDQSEFFVDREVPVTVTLSAGSAPVVGAADFTSFTPVTVTLPTSNTISEQGEERTVNARFTIVGDQIVEGNENLILTINEISSTVGAAEAVGTIAAPATAAIVDNDETDASVTVDVTQALIGSAHTATVTLGKNLAVPATFMLEAIAPDSSGTGSPVTGITIPDITIQPTATTSDAAFNIPGDATVGQQFRVRIVETIGTTPDYTSSRQTALESRVTIDDNAPSATTGNITVAAPGQMTMTATTTAADEDGPTAGEFTINLTNVIVDEDVIIPYTHPDDATLNFVSETNDYASTVSPSPTTAGVPPSGGVTLSSRTFSGTVTPVIVVPSELIAATSGVGSGGATNAAVIKFIITPVRDKRVEYKENVLLSLTAPTVSGAVYSYTEETNVALRTVSIADRTGLITVSVDSPVAESASNLPVTFTVTEEGVVLDRPVFLTLTTGDDPTANALQATLGGIDYPTTTNQVVELSSGTAFNNDAGGNDGTNRTHIVPVTFVVNNDTLIEGDETFRATLTEIDDDTSRTPTNDLAVTDPASTGEIITITDTGELTPVVTVTLDATPTEGQPLNAYVELTGGTFAEDATFTLNLALGTATAADVSVPAAVADRQVIIRAGKTGSRDRDGGDTSARSVPVTIVAETIPVLDGGETFSINIAATGTSDPVYSGTPARQAAIYPRVTRTDTALVPIVDAPTGATAEIVVGNAAAAEPSTNGTFTVTLTNVPLNATPVIDYAISTSGNRQATGSSTNDCVAGTDTEDYFVSASGADLDSTVGTNGLEIGSATAGSLTFGSISDGEAMATITINVCADNRIEHPETVTLTLAINDATTRDTDGFAVTGNAATVNIADAIEQISISAPTTVNEGARTIEITLTATSGIDDLSVDRDVSLSLEDGPDQGEATPGTDFEQITGSRLIKTGSNTVTLMEGTAFTGRTSVFNVELDIVADDIVEDPQMFAIAVVGDNAVDGAAHDLAVSDFGTHEVTINDVPPMITAFIADPTNVNEPPLTLDGSNQPISTSTSVPIILRTTANVTLERTISLGFQATTGGTVAADGSDFTAVAATTVTVPTAQALPTGDTSIELSANEVPIFGDDVVEGSEQFMVTLTNTDSAITINPATRAVTIMDHDSATATVAVTGTPRTNDDTATATVTLDTPLVANVTFTLVLLGPEAGGNVPAGVALPTVLAERQVTITAGNTDGGADVPIDITTGVAGGVFRVGIVQVGQTNKPTYTARSATLEGIVNIAAASGEETIVSGPAIRLSTDDSTGADTTTGTPGNTASYLIELSGYAEGVFADESPTATRASVNYAFTGTATFGADYRVTGFFSDNGGLPIDSPVFDYTDNGDGTFGTGAGTFTFPSNRAFQDGAADLILTVRPLADAFIEDPESVILTLSAPTIGTSTSTSTTLVDADTFSGPADVAVTINDAENQITVAVDPADVTLAEGDTAIPVTFTASVANTVLKRAVNVRLNTRDKGGANAATATGIDADYGMLNELVTLQINTEFSVAVGDDRGTALTEIVSVPISITNDDIVEGDEVFEVRFTEDSSLSEPAVELPVTTDVTIEADDTDLAPVITSVTLRNAAEGDSGGAGSETGRVVLNFRDLIVGESMELQYTIAPAGTATDADVTDTEGAIGETQTITLPGTAGTEESIPIEFTAVYDMETDEETVTVTINSLKFTPYTSPAGALISDVQYRSGFSDVSRFTGDDEGTDVADSVATLTLLQSGAPNLTVATSTPDMLEEGDTGTLDFEITVNNAVPGEDVAFTYVLDGTATETDYTVAALLPDIGSGSDTALSIVAVSGVNGGRITVDGDVINSDTDDGSNSAAGSAKVTLSFTPNDDNRVEPTATETIILADLSGRTAGVGYTPLAASTRTLTIVDKTDIIAVTLATTALDEGTTSGVTLNFTADAGGEDVVLERAITVNLTTDDGGAVQATADTDYVRIPSSSVVSVVLPAITNGLATTIVDGEPATRTGAITINPDELVEGPETFSVLLDDVLVPSGVDDPAVTVTSPTAVTITDTDSAPTVLSVRLDSPAERAGLTPVVIIDLDRRLASTERVDITYTILTPGTGDAASDSDLEEAMAATTQIMTTIDANEQTGQIQVTASEDNVAESSPVETFQVRIDTMTFTAYSGVASTPAVLYDGNFSNTDTRLIGASAGSAVTGSVANLTILEGPTATLTALGSPLTEGDVGGTADTATFTIAYSNLGDLISGGVPILGYEFSGDAEFGSDYTVSVTGATPGSLNNSGSLDISGNITPSGSNATRTIVITVETTRDNYDEENENITLTVSRLSGTTPDTPDDLIFTETALTITLNDDDTATAAITIDNLRALEEGLTTSTFTLDITNAPAGAVPTVNYSFTASDAAYNVNYTLAVTGDSPNVSGENFASGDSFTMAAGNTQGETTARITVTPIDESTTNSHTVVFTVDSITFSDDGMGTDIGTPAAIAADGTRIITGSPATITIVDKDLASAELSINLDGNDYYALESTTDVGDLVIDLEGVPNDSGDVMLTITLTAATGSPVTGSNLPGSTDGGTGASGGPGPVTIGGGDFTITDADSANTLYVLGSSGSTFTVTIPRARFEDDSPTGDDEGEERVVLQIGTGAAAGGVSAADGVGIDFDLDDEIVMGMAGTDNVEFGGSGEAPVHIRASGSFCLRSPALRDAVMEDCDDYDPATDTEPLPVMLDPDEPLETEDFMGFTMTPTLEIMGTGTLPVLPDLEMLTSLSIAPTVTLVTGEGVLDEVLDTLTSLTYPRPATMELEYMEPNNTTQATALASLNGGGGGLVPLQDDRNGTLTVSLDVALPVTVQVAVTAVCEEGVVIRFEGGADMVTVIIPSGRLEPDSPLDVIDVAAMREGVDVPAAERIDCVFNPVITLLEDDGSSITHATDPDAIVNTDFMGRDRGGDDVETYARSETDPVKALINEVRRGGTSNVPVEQIISETEAITTVLAREQVGMVTRLVRQRVQDLALSRPAINTTASADTAGNDDMEVSLAQSPDNMQDFVSGLALNTARDMDAGGSYSLWARGQWVNISGSPDIGIEGFDYDGNVVGAGVGVEFRDYNSMFGIALNATRAEVDVTSTSRGKTTHEEDMFFAAPYAAWKSKFSGLTLWGTVGVGTGTAEITEADGDTADPGVTVFFTRGGMDVASEISDRTDLVFGLSGLFIDKTVEKFSLGSDSIKEINVQAGQAQVDLTAFLNFPVGDTIFRPYFGLASVHEVGDIIADDRHAMEARTGFGWDNHPWYLDVDGFYEFLREDEEAWGIFGEIRYAETNSGFQFGMTGNHGTASSMSEAATSTNTVASEFDASLGNADSEEAEWSLGAESSYSFAAPVFDRSGTAAPFISGTHAESGQTLGTGVRVGLTENIDMTVESDRHMPDNDDPYSEHAVGLNARWAF